VNEGVLEHVAAVYSFDFVRRVDGVGTRVLRAATPIGEVAIKVFEDIATARLESALLAHLAPPDPRARVQRLVFTAHGEPLCTGDFGAAIVTHWEAGVTKPYDEITAVQWHVLGRSLGALHERLDDFDEMPVRWSQRFAARDMAKERHDVEAARAVVMAKDPSRAPMLSGHLDDQLSLIDRHVERASRMPPVDELPIHNDYNQNNYLFDGRDPPLILDWDRAIAAPREFEVVRCLNHLPLVAPVHASAFVEGYLMVRDLNIDVLRWAVDAALIEHALKRWPLERWLRGEPGSDAQLTSVIAMVRTLARGACALDAFFSSVGTR
jgi:Ser/Thr protein kinase RdoA (MazF antagonist)